MHWVGIGWVRFRLEIRDPYGGKKLQNCSSVACPFDLKLKVGFGKLKLTLSMIVLNEVFENQ